MKILAPIGLGDLLDRITVLEIKRDRSEDPAKLPNILTELSDLTAVLASLTLSCQEDIENLRVELAMINSDLYTIENYLRAGEQTKQFDAAFLQSARQVYLKNDQRDSIKRRINQLWDSSI